MANKRIGPEAKIIALFTALPEDSQRIVFDILNNQSPRKVKDPKSVAPAVTRRSSRKDAKDQSTANSGDGSGNALDASNRSEKRFVPICVICGNEESFADHQPGAASYHIFRTKLKRKNSKDNGGTVLLDNPEAVQPGATA